MPGVLAVLGALGVVFGACSAAGPAGVPEPDSGSAAQTQTIAITGDAGGTVQSFPAGGPGDPGANAVYVTISGESNALVGYPFPPADWTNDTYMVDGWQFTILEYIVNVDHVVMWANPNEKPTDQSQHGAQVAHLDGPFVVDLHKGGKIIGQGGSPEEATPLGVIANQNDNGNQGFDPTTTYGIGFSTVAASYAGYNVNLTSDEVADFDLMVQRGYSVMYVGRAAWMGSASQYGCTQTSTGTASAASTGTDGGSGDAGSTAYDFGSLPTSMTFRLGFSTPTSYVNCQNESLQGTALAGEEFPRGVQVSPSQSAIAQVTVHMDHPFWESLAEDSPVHWDQIAAQYIGAGDTPEATVEDMKGVPFYAFTDKTGAAIPWRNCSGTNYTAPGNGQMSFNALSVPVNPTETDPSKALRDYYDYLRFSQSTQGHLNSQGVCYVARNYPAPAGGS